MTYLTFCVRCQFQCEDGSIFSWIFEEGHWCFADAPHTIVDGEVFVYTPEECIGRAVRTFFSGLTDWERKQAAKTLKIEARQIRELEAL